MLIVVILFLATCFLAYSNGANDNFKGVATLFGSGTTNYRTALMWATMTTLAGSMASIVLATSLIQRFSGKGLLPDSIVASPEFLLAVAVGAALTVMLATVTGFPISTTHGLVGALLGSGFVAIGTDINLSVLGKSFFLPLLVSPLLACSLGFASYQLLHLFRLRLGITKAWCVCVGTIHQVIPITQTTSTLSISPMAFPGGAVDTVENCTELYAGKLFGINTEQALNLIHYFSAGMVSFARGLNDTPKIVALLLGTSVLGVQWGMATVGGLMAIGGLLSAKKVTQTMSQKITSMNPEQGLTANVVTSLLVIFASYLALPVSTTHVSVGSLFGIGLVTGKADIRVVSSIIASWLLTLPIAAILSGGAYFLLRLLLN